MSTNPYYPYVIPNPPAVSNPVDYYPSISNVSAPFPYCGRTGIYNYYEYTYPTSYPLGQEIYYNNYRTPYYPFGPYKVGPYY
jgi:hypothetical protein